MDWKLELVVLPVADVDRAKAFYLEQAGFDLLVDHREGRPSGWSRSPRRARRAPLPSWPTPGPPARSRASTSSSTTSTPHTTSSPPVGPDRARSSTSTPDAGPGPDPERRDYNSFLSFADPDGNAWLVQEVRGSSAPAGRAPRVEPGARRRARAGQPPWGPNGVGARTRWRGRDDPGRRTERLGARHGVEPRVR